MPVDAPVVDDEFDIASHRIAAPRAAPLRDEFNQTEEGQVMKIKTARRNDALRHATRRIEFNQTNL